MKNFNYTFSTRKSMRTKLVTSFLLFEIAARHAAALLSGCIDPAECGKNELNPEAFQTLKKLCPYFFPDWLEEFYSEGSLNTHLQSAVIYYDNDPPEGLEAAKDFVTRKAKSCNGDIGYPWNVALYTLAPVIWEAQHYDIPVISVTLPLKQNTAEESGGVIKQMVRELDQDYFNMLRVLAKIAKCATQHGFGHILFPAQFFDHNKGLDIGSVLKTFGFRGTSGNYNKENADDLLSKAAWSWLRIFTGQSLVVRLWESGDWLSKNSAISVIASPAVNRLMSFQPGSAIREASIKKDN